MMDWLRRYVGRDGSHRWYGEVVHCDGWSVATDARSLVAVRMRSAKISPVSSQKMVRPFLTMQPVNAIRTTLGNLHLFAGAVYWEWCDWCNGTGFLDGGDTREVPCEDCDGMGKYWPAHDADSRGFICGMLCDLSRLAWALAPELYSAPAGVRAGVNSAFHVPVLIFDGDGWRVIQSGMEVESPAQKKAGPAPTFHPEDEFAQLWIERDDPAARLILADWLADHDDPYHLVLRGET